MARSMHIEARCVFTNGPMGKVRAQAFALKSALNHGGARWLASGEARRVSRMWLMVGVLLQMAILGGSGGVAAAQSEPTGTASPVQTASFTLNSTFTLGSISVVTEGYTGLDFNVAPGGTCAVNGTYGSSNGCTVNYTFTPTAVGVRLGAILLYNSSGGLVATQYISGIGQGPVMQFLPATVITAAGTGGNCSTVGGSCGDGGLATAATVNKINSIAIDAQGNIYLADINASVIRKITKATGDISTLVGTENSRCLESTSACGDGGPATSALLNAPSMIDIDGAGNLYITDKGDNRVRVVNLNTGTINAFAGTGTPCPYSTATCGDGNSALSAYLNSPDGIAIDASGNVYVGDTNDNRIRKVTSATGGISTIAGTGVACTGSACSVSGVSAATAQISTPNEIHFDASGNLYITDSTANVLREILITNGNVGNIQTVAGTGTRCPDPASACGDGGLATNAELNTVWGFTIDGANNIYIADQGDYKIRFVNSTTGIISTVMGTGSICLPTTATCGDGGPATAATLYYPNSLIFDPQGNVLISDDTRMRELTFASSSLSFANTNVNSTSSDSPKHVTIVNAGNAALSLSVPMTGSNPSLTTGFTLDSTTTCPQILYGGSAGSLAVGASCVYAVNFTPTVGGLDSGDLVITDNDLGGIGSTQPLSLVGIGLGPAPAIEFSTAPAATVTAGGNAGSAVTVEELNSNNTLDSTGSDLITITVTGPTGYTATYTATAVNGIATFNLSSDILTASGSYTYTATLTSDPPAVAMETVTAGAAANFVGNGPGASGQSTVISTAYPNPFAVLVKDTYGNPVAGTVVTYAAPTSGASAVLSATTATSNSAGIATVSGTANGMVGSFMVTATINGISGSVTFAVTNTQATPTITWAPPVSATTVTYGTSLASALTATATYNGVSVPGTFTYSASTAGAVTGTSVLSVGIYTITVTFTPTNSIYKTESSTITYTVNKATPSVSLVSATTSVFIQTAVNYTATVTGTATLPAGTVTFYDGTAMLGTSSVSSSGVATLSSTPTTAGTHNITAMFNGSSLYNTATSNVVPELAEDFSVTATGTTAVTVNPNNTATYTFTVAPVSGTVFPAAMTLTPSGGSTSLMLSLTPATIASGAGTTNLTLTVGIPATVLAQNRGPDIGKRLAPMSLAFLLLPLVGRLRKTRRQRGGGLALLLILVIGVGATSLSGCSVPAGYFGQQPKAYTLTVTGVSGSLSHSANVTLTVE